MITFLLWKKNMPTPRVHLDQSGVIKGGMLFYNTNFSTRRTSFVDLMEDATKRQISIVERYPHNTKSDTTIEVGKY